MDDRSLIISHAKFHSTSTRRRQQTRIFSPNRVSRKVTAVKESRLPFRYNCLVRDSYSTYRRWLDQIAEAMFELGDGRRGLGEGPIF